jgi:hypothetical protein
MPLTETQISDLARTIQDHMNLPGLILLAAMVSVNLDNLAPVGSLKTRAETLLKVLNSERPPRDRQLLQVITNMGPTQINQAIQDLAAEYLHPTYAPSGDPHDALLLGRSGFFGRADLRQNIREFTSPNNNSSRVLIVRGAEPGGKTHSWGFLLHLGMGIGVKPVRLQLNKGKYSPRQVVEAVCHLLQLNSGSLPKLVDDPQPMRIVADLSNWFQGQLASLQHDYWLVIDDLNDPNVDPATRLAAYELARVVESNKAQRLWVVLLGYNEAVTDREMRWCVKDDASFFTAKMLAGHFAALAPPGQPLAEPQASQYAELVFSKYPRLDRDAMNELSSEAEILGDKLRLGLQP